MEGCSACQYGYIPEADTLPNFLCGEQDKHKIRVEEKASRNKSFLLRIEGGKVVGEAFVNDVGR